METGSRVSNNRKGVADNLDTPHHNNLFSS